MDNEVLRINESKKVSIYEFANTNVVFLLPEDALWIKSTVTGLWIYNQLKKNAMNMDELLLLSSKKYNLPQKAIEPAINALIDELYKHGIIYRGEQTGKADMALQIKNEPFKEVWLNLTNHCNLNCTHCFVPDIHEAKRHIPFDLAAKIIDEAADLKFTNLTFSGGEPTLHPNLLEIIRYSKNKGQFLLKLITNGTKSNEKFFTEVVPMLDDIQVSLDGIDDETNDKIRGKGTFKKVQSFIKKLKKHGKNLRIGLSLTPLPENYEQIPELYQISSRLKIDYVQITKPKIPGKSNNDFAIELTSNEYFQKVLEKYDRYLFNMASIKREVKSLKQYSHAFNVDIDTEFDPANALLKLVKMERCGAGTMTICINQNGETYPCAALCSKVESFGNVENNSLKSITEKMKLSMEEIFSVDRDSECRECDFKYFCGGGCRANSDLSSRDILCKTLKERYMLFLENLMGPTTKDNATTTFY